MKYLSNPFVQLGLSVLIACSAVRLDSTTRVKSHKSRVYVKISILAVILSFFHIIFNTKGGDSSMLPTEDIIGGEF